MILIIYLPTLAHTLVQTCIHTKFYAFYAYTYFYAFSRILRISTHFTHFYAFLRILRIFTHFTHSYAFLRNFTHFCAVFAILWVFTHFYAFYAFLRNFTHFYAFLLILRTYAFYPFHFAHKHINHKHTMSRTNVNGAPLVKSGKSLTRKCCHCMCHKNRFQAIYITCL